MDDICPVVLDGVTGFGGRVEVVLFKLVAQLMHIRRCTHEEPAFEARGAHTRVGRKIDGRDVIEVRAAGPRLASHGQAAVGSVMTAATGTMKAGSPSLDAARPPRRRSAATAAVLSGVT
jgi:hypothetical protein